MNGLAELLKALDEAHWEFTLAFEGLSDDDLWRRPHENLLSIGELAAHVAFGEGRRTLVIDAEDEDPNSFLYHSAYYYPYQLKSPTLARPTVEEVLKKVAEIHEAAKEALQRDVKSLEDPWPKDPQWTWGSNLRYMVFHVAYHTGQAYSVRHLFGHTPTDN
ncbi:MAG: DUF664 domain-containing protein [Armatimonadetes bacterium]|nr:DUF664 domain-containing protein [Armatimonadota bacterium]